MEKAQDLRITKTHKALCDAFMALLEKKKFEDITVHELCEKAVIRRATFYKHFADKYEFFIFFIRDVQAAFETEVVPFYASEQPQEYFIRMTRKLIEFLGEHQSMVDCIFKSDMLPTLVNMLSEQIIIVAKERLTESSKNGFKLPASPEILASFYVGGLLQVLIRRFSQKPRRTKKSEEEVMTEIENVIRSISAEI